MHEHGGCAFERFMDYAAPREHCSHPRGFLSARDRLVRAQRLAEQAEAAASAGDAKAQLYLDLADTQIELARAINECVGRLG